MQGLGLSVKNRPWSLHVVQVLIHLNIIQWFHYEGVGQALSRLRDMKRVVNLAKFLRHIQMICNLSHRAITMKGPIYLGPNLPRFLNRITPFQGDTFRSTIFPTRNSKYDQRLSAMHSLKPAVYLLNYLHSLEYPLRTPHESLTFLSLTNRCPTLSLVKHLKGRLINVGVAVAIV